MVLRRFVRLFPIADSLPSQASDGSKHGDDLNAVSGRTCVLPSPAARSARREQGGRLFPYPGDPGPQRKSSGGGTRPCPFAGRGQVHAGAKELWPGFVHLRKRECWHGTTAVSTASFRTVRA